MSDVFFSWTQTWPEILDIIAKGDSVKTLNGELWSKLETERDKDRLFCVWTDDIVYASSAGHTVPPRVLDNFNAWKNQKSLLRPESVAPPSLAMTPPAPAKKPFSWSYTALTDFENCPLGYAHTRVYKDAVVKPWDHREWGNRVHSAVQKVLQRQEMTEDAELVAPYRKYTDFLLKAAQGGLLRVEEQIALNEALCQTDWFAADAWGRFIIDVLIVKDGTAYVYDWKTGKVRNDETQLKMFCAVAALLYPHIDKFIAKFIWLKTNEVTGLPGAISREEAMAEWANILWRVERMKEAWDSEIWQARPSGLCPYCGWYSKCEYRR